MITEQKDRCALGRRHRFLRRSGSRVFSWGSLIVALGFLFLPARADNGNEALNYYGLLTLSDSAVGARLAARFKAVGQPVFLVHDLSAGLGQGDIMRFQNKAVLVDGDVWNTLQAENALEKLRAAPVVRVQGQTRSASWEQRAALVTGPRERKAFKLGAELIKVFEDTFGGAPLRNQLTVEFHDGYLTLLAPAALLDQLRFTSVRRVAERGGPRIVSPPPDSLLFVGQPFFYQVWAIDPTAPATDLTYRLQGDLPAGLTWDAARHELQGTPTVGGRFRLTAEARDAKGGRDTLGFSLRLHFNRPPLLAATPKPVAVIGQPWRFRPEPVDPDHASYLLRVWPTALAPGMRFDPDSLELDWTPDSTLAGSRQTFSLAVQDPLGSRRDFQYAVQVITPDEIPWSGQIRVDLPWDTLLQGRSYTWKAGATAAAWAAQGVVLQQVEGSDSTAFAGGVLHLRPMQAGTQELDFHFEVQGSLLVHRIYLPVRQAQPPQFVTELAAWRSRAGDPPLRYRPVAVDPQGEPVTLHAEVPPGSPIQWDGRQLSFTAGRPGIYPARITATDLGGQTAEQWVAFRADPPPRKVRWFLENRVQSDMTAWTVTADFGTGRIGLYSPNLGQVLSLSAQSDREYPFIFFGGNLMGRDQEAKGRRLWTDLGFTLRLPAANIATGGVYGRIEGEWAFSHSLISWVEAEFTGHVHQALVLADTGSFRLLLRDQEINQLVNQYSGVIGEIVNQSTADDNAVFFSRIEAYSSLGQGFYAGPCLWREDLPMAQKFYQRIGGGLRYKDAIGDLITQFSLHAGWGPGGAGYSAYANMLLSLGAGF